MGALAVRRLRDLDPAERERIAGPVDRGDLRPGARRRRSRHHRGRARTGDAAVVRRPRTLRRRRVHARPSCESRRPSSPPRASRSQRDRHRGDPTGNREHPRLQRARARGRVVACRDRARAPGRGADRADRLRRPLRPEREGLLPVRAHAHRDAGRRGRCRRNHRRRSALRRARARCRPGGAGGGERARADRRLPRRTDRPVSPPPPSAPRRSRGSRKIVGPGSPAVDRRADPGAGIRLCDRDALRALREPRHRRRGRRSGHPRRRSPQRGRARRRFRRPARDGIRDARGRGRRRDRAPARGAPAATARLRERRAVSVRAAPCSFGDLDEACAFANEYAPEHLLLSVREPDALLPKLEHAGEILLGQHAVRGRELPDRRAEHAADRSLRAVWPRASPRVRSSKTSSIGADLARGARASCPQASSRSRGTRASRRTPPPSWLGPHAGAGPLSARRCSVGSARDRTRVHPKMAPVSGVARRRARHARRGALRRPLRRSGRRAGRS